MDRKHIVIDPKRLIAIIAAIAWPACAQPQPAPAQWSYSFDVNNNATASYPGNVNIAGTLNGGGSGGTSSNFGAAFPTNGTAAGAKSQSGSLMNPLNLDFGGNMYMDSNSPLSSTGFVAVGSFSTATGFTPPAGSISCFIQTEGNNVRFRTDGTNPTAAAGQLLVIGAQLILTSNLAGVKFIPTTGSATLDVDCYK